MSSNEEIINIKEADELDDLQLMEYLLQHWKLRSPEIEGIARHERDLWWLKDVTDAKGNRLEYPLYNLPEHLGLGKKGIFIPPVDIKNLTDGQHLSARFDIADRSKRQQAGNPLLLKVEPYSIKYLTEIPEDRVLVREDGSIAIEETLCLNYIRNNNEAVDLALEDINKHIEECKRLQETLEKQKYDAYAEITQKKEELTELKEQLAENEKSRAAILGEIENDFKKERDRREQELQVHINELNRRIEEIKLEIVQYEEEASDIKAQVDEMRSKFQLEEERFRNQADELRQYVRSKADRLLQLEFITEEQVSALLPKDKQERDDCKDWPTIGNSKEDKAQAISHIQRYLYSKKIVYPLSLLENFYTLLCTGDLIILSGLSGSGKTNLVKSFAEVTGNVSHIISVKPNWTSAEDLTGYYNPLQRSYLTTPFLDAISEAQKDPDRLHIICLDEMNLARVEYYFADFLSCLEERKTLPKIPLYSDNEAANVLCEFRLFAEMILGICGDEEITNLIDFLKKPDVVEKIKQQLGIDDGESFLQLHSRLRRMVSGVLSVPSELRIPGNVRFVGAVNMDDTTHFMSPKVLDRSHVIQFENPLMHWNHVATEVEGTDFPETGILIPSNSFPRRKDYPSYDPAKSDNFTNVLLNWAKNYLAPIGIDFGVRTLRQCIHYREQLSAVVSDVDVDSIALNNLLRQKLMPRFSFDGTVKPRGRTEENCAAIVDLFYLDVVEKIPDLKVFNAAKELEYLIGRAQANHNIFNYWT